MAMSGAPTSDRWAYNFYKWDYNLSYPFKRPFIGVIIPFMTSRGPPCRILDKFTRVFNESNIPILILCNSVGGADFGAITKLGMFLRCKL